LTRGDANAYAGYNIRINAIAPGFIPTASTAHVLGMENSPLNSEVARTPLKRTGDVEEISDALVLMASTMNSFQQGAVHIVDGGFTSN
jgi:NAD(P)-dependent dehydrogenase (short-subunit alcohol dehydrogenase family)